MKVMQALPEDEIDQFLPVFSEVIVWGATDEGITDLVDKLIVNDKPAS